MFGFSKLLPSVLTLYFIKQTCRAEAIVLASVALSPEDSLQKPRKNSGQVEGLEIPTVGKLVTESA